MFLPSIRIKKLNFAGLSTLFLVGLLPVTLFSGDPVDMTMKPEKQEARERLPLIEQLENGQGSAPEQTEPEAAVVEEAPTPKSETEAATPLETIAHEKAPAADADDAAGLAEQPVEAINLPPPPPGKPDVTQVFSGRDGELKATMINKSDKRVLVYDQTGKRPFLDKVVLKNGEKPAQVFDMKGERKGQLQKANDGRRHAFDTEGEWHGSMKTDGTDPFETSPTEDPFGDGASRGAVFMEN